MSCVLQLCTSEILSQLDTDCLMDLFTWRRSLLQRLSIADILQLGDLERRVLGAKHGEISSNFGIVWVQPDTRLPRWCTCDNSVMFVHCDFQDEDDEESPRNNTVPYFRHSI